MPVITSTSFGTFALLKRAARRLVFFHCWTRTFRGSFTQGIPSWRAGLGILSFSFECTLFLGVMFHSTLFPSKALTICRPLYAISIFSFSFTLRPALGCSIARGGVFHVVFHEKRNASHELCVRSTGPPYVSVWCILKDHLLEQHLECTATPTALAARPVEADDNTQFPQK